MSVYDDIPADFPLNVDIKERPVSYVLDVSTSEKIIYVVMSIFWLLFIPLMIMMPVVDAPEDAPVADWVFYLLSALSLAYVYFAGRYWLWRNIASCFNRVAITIGTDLVEVHQQRLFNRSQWSEPISNYVGVGVENRGTQTIGSNKIPVSAIILKHRDDNRSIPIVIDGAMKVSEKRAARRAHSLGLPFIEGVLTGEAVEFHSKGTVVVNRWQATKVRALYACFAAATVLFAAIGLYQSMASELEPAYPILAVLFVAACFGMHLYTRSYVTGLSFDEKTGSVTLKTADLFANTHVFPLAAIASTAYREGKQTGGRINVHAPWVSLRVQGAPRPFIVDMQSEYVDETWLQRLESVQ